MTILIVCPRYAPSAGGIETLLAQLLPELATRGLDFVVAAGSDDLDFGPKEVIDGIPVYRVPFTHAVVSADPRMMLEATKRLREIEIDHEVTIRHLHGFGDVGQWHAMRSHDRRPMPLAISVHGTFEWLGELGQRSHDLLCAADVITAVSERVRAAVVAELGGVDRTVRIIPNGLRFDDAAPVAWPEGGFLLCVGRLLEQKGFDVAIEALALLATMHPRLELVIAGDGANANDIRYQAERWGVSSRVRMLGRVPRQRIRHLMDDASVILVPSRHTEGFSLAALEAAHAARPVIASSVGGLAETVEDGVTGVLVPPDRPLALARAIDELLGDPARATLMGKRGRERADELFSLDACVEAYHQLYEELAAKVSARAVSGERS